MRPYISGITLRWVCPSVGHYRNPERGATVRICWNRIYDQSETVLILCKKFQHAFVHLRQDVLSSFQVCASVSVESTGQK